MTERDYLIRTLEDSGLYYVPIEQQRKRKIHEEELAYNEKENSKA
jgi:hypothetical protein